MGAGTIIQVIRWHKAPPCALVHSVHNRFGDRWMYGENRSPASVPLTQTLLRIATPSKLGRAWSNDPGPWILVHAGINGWRDSPAGGARPRAGHSTLPPPRWSSCLLYTSPSPRDGLLSRMP